MILGQFINLYCKRFHSFFLDSRVPSEGPGESSGGLNISLEAWRALWEASRALGVTWRSLCKVWRAFSKAWIAHWGALRALWGAWRSLWGDSRALWEAWRNLLEALRAPFYRTTSPIRAAALQKWNNFNQINIAWQGNRWPFDVLGLPRFKSMYNNSALDFV